MSRRVATVGVVLALAPLALGAARTERSEASAVRPLDIAARVTLRDGGGATLVQRGTFAGAPLGRGRVDLRTSVGRGRGATFTFVMRNGRGSIRGRGDVALTFRGATIVYRGSAAITGGSGAFRTMRGRGLRVAGRGAVSGETFAVRLTGRVRA